LAKGFNNMVSNIDDLINENYILQIKEKDAQMKALQICMNPHFIYNTLDIIYWQAENANQEDIADTVLRLSRLLRLSIGNGHIFTTVDKEVELISSYLTLQKLRFGNKLEYKINQKGTNLSGGQKQRLQIARTLLKKSNIIIFDDSMSAIDLKTERKIIDNINSFYQDKTIIYISSRISSFKNFDKIILMNDGQIIDIGSHEQLMKNDLYKIMYETQVNNYE